MSSSCSVSVLASRSSGIEFVSLLGLCGASQDSGSLKCSIHFIQKISSSASRYQSFRAGPEWKNYGKFVQSSSLSQHGWAGILHQCLS